MLILALIGMYFDAIVVFLTSQTLLFRLALAILWMLLKREKIHCDKKVATYLLSKPKFGFEAHQRAFVGAGEWVGRILNSFFVKIGDEQC